MTKQEFMELPLNTQWAIVEYHAFGGYNNWDYNEGGERKWLDCEGEIIPDETLTVQKLAAWLNMASRIFDVFIPFPTSTWKVICRNSKKLHCDDNLPWAILMAAAIPEKDIVEPVMILENVK